MKINISRQSIYLLALSIFLLILVLVFSFAVLIPEGKEYRKQRGSLNKAKLELRKYEKFNDVVLKKLKELNSNSRKIVTAFDTSFNPKKFKKQHKIYFISLNLSKLNKAEDEEPFAVYEVNTSSSINSPQNFYDFLDAINKSDWIIGVNLPINFKRDDKVILSSFTMKVYATQRVSKAMLETQ
ncbi:MAG: hypothetical protein JJW00_05770 [Sulfurimonas sp.]|nr:hypothetical protein [Sulfurimonas sp.]